MEREEGPRRPSAKRATAAVLGPAGFAAMRSLYRTVNREELRASRSLPLRLRLRAWTRGFRAISAALYGEENLASGLYLSDYARLFRGVNINPISAVFDHKLLLHTILAARGVRQAETIALVSRHGVLLDPTGGDARYVTPRELAERLVRDGGRYIWKPESGTRGDGIALIEVDGGRLVARRGDATKSFEFTRARGTEVYLLQRAVEQHPFWRSLSPHSVNTMRILTLWTPGDEAPFIARAVQRIGTRATLPTDNWSGGGINALIDLTTGTLGPGRVNPYKSGREDRRYTHHPESGAPIEGALLPHWHAIARATLSAARGLPHAPYVGWDIAVDGAGSPLVIEANKNTDVDLLQVHGGLLADAAVRRFYLTCGVT